MNIFSKANTIFTSNLSLFIINILSFYENIYQEKEKKFKGDRRLDILS